MPIDEGYRRYSCDVASCGRLDYGTDGSPEAAGYVTREWVDANGQARRAVLCTTHSQVFDQVAQRHDQDLAELLKTGEDRQAKADAEWRTALDAADAKARDAQSARDEALARADRAEQAQAESDRKASAATDAKARAETERDAAMARADSLGKRVEELEAQVSTLTAELADATGRKDGGQGPSAKPDEDTGEGKEG